MQRLAGLAIGMLVFAAAACGTGHNSVGGGGGGGTEPDAAAPGADGAPATGDAPSGTGGDAGSAQAGCGGLLNCYSVYAHSDHVLYVVDLQAKTLQEVGPFNPANSGTSNVITDLAVAPDNTIYVVSESALFTASATDGHITKVGSLATCGAEAVALTTTPDGKLWTGDFKGSICQIDFSVSPPQVLPPVTMGNSMALSGDLVAVGDGTVFGTAYTLSGTQSDNVLVKVDLTTGAVTRVGPTGYPELYGTSFAFGNVIGFTHDGTGRVVQIDPTTGAGSLFATFSDPTTGVPIAFAGAGVNSLVSVIQ